MLCITSMVLEANFNCKFQSLLIIKTDSKQTLREIWACPFIREIVESLTQPFYPKTPDGDWRKTWRLRVLENTYKIK